MTATLDYLNKWIADKPAPDWIYVANFQRPHRPRPYRLPAGQGRVLRDRMRTVVTELKDVLKRTLKSAEYVGENRRLSDSIKGPIAAEFEEIRRYALGLGLDIQATSQGMMMMIAGQGGQPGLAENLSEEERERVKKSMAEIEERLQAFRRGAQAAEARLSDALAGRAPGFRRPRRRAADRCGRGRLSHALPLVRGAARGRAGGSLDAITSEDGGMMRDMNGPPESATP